MFDDFQKHCTECEKGTPCGKYHVYVLTLDPKIAVEKKRFRLANPDTYETGEALYVGKTECVPRCRQEKHRGFESFESSTWRCFCGLRSEINKYHPIRDRPTKVKEYLKGGYGFLKPKLFKRLNPFDQSSEALEAEAALAVRLRQQGYAVWAGHHDNDIVDRNRRIQSKGGHSP